MFTIRVKMIKKVFFFFNYLLFDYGKQYFEVISMSPLLEPELTFFIPINAAEMTLFDAQR